MENEIIGEKLRGLYEAIAHISDRELAEGKVRQEMGSMAGSCAEVAQELAAARGELAEVLRDRDVTRGELASLAKMRSEAQEELTTLSRSAKEKLNFMQGKVIVLEEDREKMREHAAKLDKKYKDLAEEYEKLRLRLKQFHQKRKLFGEFEEKVCKHCQKMFIENTNFNWSCKTHYSEYSGEMYWCCGMPGKDAAGCRVSKHQAKDDDDEEENPITAALPIPGTEQTTAKCGSCKDYGHRASECPRDPNLRTNFDMSEELDRVQEIAKRKKHASTGMADCLGSLKVLSARKGRESFNQAIVGTSPDVSDLSDDSEEREDKEKQVFEEIMRIRRDRARAVSRRGTFSLERDKVKTPNSAI